MYAHTTVLRDETVAAVVAGLPSGRVADGGWLVDATLGGGGHSEAILAATADRPALRVLGIDRDPAALDAARARLAPFGDRFIAVHGHFGGVAEIALRHCGIARERAGGGLCAVVADLGLSSHQVDTAERGFSFRQDGPLDMRMDPTGGPTAAELLANVRVEDLADILYRCGDIRRSIGTARVVIEEFSRGADTTARLAERLTARLPRHRSLHPATQVFQALRMWVNDEPGELDALLRDAPWLVADGGAVAIITFHSGEDRAVKHAFAALARTASHHLPIRRGVVADQEEVALNPRARSARLRVAVRGARPGSEDLLVDDDPDDDDPENVSDDS